MPTPHLKGADIATGADLFSLNCAACHTIEGSGDVYNLHDVKDFPGNYVSVGAGATLAGGGTFAMLQNQNGVWISFHSTTQGLKLNLSPEGVSVDLK